MATRKKGKSKKETPGDLDFKELLNEGRKIGFQSLSKDLKLFSIRLDADAVEWNNVSARDKWSIASTYLDLMMAEYELWLLEMDLDYAVGRTIDPTFNISLGFPTAVGLSFAMRGDGLGGKLRAVGGSLEEVTGLPFDFLAEFFFDEFSDLLEALQEIADEKKKNGKSTRYREIERKIKNILEKIFQKLKGPALRKAFVSKVGVQTAKRIFRKLATKMLPFVGWIDFAIDLLKALRKYGKKILDP